MPTAGVPGGWTQIVVSPTTASPRRYVRSELYRQT